MQGAIVSGIGSYVPERIISNRDLELIVETSEEWIVSHTGMRQRRMAAPEEAASDLATRAAERALADAGLQADDLDMIVCSTISGDSIIPATGCMVQANLGASRAGAFDLVTGCTGFVYGLGVASAFVRSGEYQSVMVIATEVLTRVTNWSDRSTCVLFGDAAGAAVVTPGPAERGILAYELDSMGELGGLLQIPAGGSRRPPTAERLARQEHKILMNGPELFKVAVRAVPELAERIVRKSGLEMEDIAWVIMHQANQRILDSVAKRLDIAEERVVSIVEDYGNTSAASMPLALDLVYRQGKLRDGDNLLMVGFGAGFTLGGTVLRWSKDGVGPVAV